MKIFKKVSQIFVATLIIVTFVNENKADAGILKIINKSEDRIKIHILPSLSETPYCWKCFESHLIEGGRQSSEVIVPLDAFSGQEYYSVVDVGDGFIDNGKCKNLSVLKNYEVYFSDTTLGTSCEVREINIQT